LRSTFPNSFSSMAAQRGAAFATAIHGPEDD
jgi:hypothetical protein